ncbi:protein disulfide oxidoreductase [Vibrio splendidus]
MMRKKAKAKPRTKKQKLRSALLYTLFALVVVFGVDYWRTKDVPMQNVPPMVGMSLSGKPIDVIEMSKKEPVLVYFWTTWCVACKFVTPVVDWFSSSYPVVGVSLTSGKDERVQRYMNAKGYSYDNINDTQGKIARDWGISLTPTLIVINDGKVTSVTSGITTPIGIAARLWLAKY